MPELPYPKNEFLSKVIAVIEENLSDEHFGVIELSEQVNMSRSNLLRKVKKSTGVSVSVLIRQVRLHHAKELLNDDSLNVSEISYKVGFNSTSYFTKCFREYFGYTPGAQSKQRLKENEVAISEIEIAPKKRKILLLISVITGVLLMGTIFFVLLKDKVYQENSLEKTIAVLPFKNDSNDTTNVYIINGLMEAILDNLQKIDELKVTSRTTVEKYRGVTKTVRELSKELDVNYFVEGSGQKIGDQILLTIQLIEARSDKHIWSQRYEREAKDIFKLQMEVAKNIAGQIEAIITPIEAKRIEKVPTENLIAYDYYLQGLDLTKQESREVLITAINFFEKAITEDDQFAHAYAYVAICYYYLDIYQADKKYGLEINDYADKAILYDGELAESLIAKALFYMHDGQYKLAVKHFEKVLKYYPNSGWVHNFLTDIYTSYLPNTEKYLNHALQGIQFAVASQDSITASYTYLHLSNALAQMGFIKEAERYIKISLAYNSKNLFSEYVYAYIKLARNFDLAVARESIMHTLNKDSTRIDVIQELAKICYTMKDYETSWYYYEKFIRIKEMLDLEIYQGENIKIAFVLNQLGRKQESEKYLKSYKLYAENDQSIYRDLNLSAYYAVVGSKEQAMKYLKAFSEQENYQYWFILFLEKDPIMEQFSTHSDFKPTLKKIENKFWNQHKKMRKLLKQEGILED